MTEILQCFSYGYYIGTGDVLVVQLEVTVPVEASGLVAFGLLQALAGIPRFGNSVSHQCHGRGPEVAKSVCRWSCDADAQLGCCGLTESWKTS